MSKQKLLQTVFMLSSVLGIGGCKRPSKLLELQGGNAGTVSKITVEAPVKETTTATWRHRVDFVETYDECFSSDGKILILVMHGTQMPDSEWGVYKNGGGYGDYVSEQQAIKAAAKLVPECRVPEKK